MNSNPTLTPALVFALNPCQREPGQRHSLKGLETLFGGPALSLSTILRREDLPYNDRMWVALQALPVSDFAPIWREWACLCAEGCLSIFEARYPEDNRPRQAIEAARRYGRGEISLEQLKSNRKAAYAAAYAADSAYAAATHATAAHAAASDATSDADAGAYAAARSKTQERHVNFLAQIIER